MTPLEFAKEQIPIPRLALLRGWDWKPGKICHIPYRVDTHPSGSVFAEGKLFHDYTTGENFDAPALLATVEGINNNAACKILMDLAGSKEQRSDSFRPETPRNLPKEARAKPFLPSKSAPSLAESKRIARLRCVSVDAVEIAVSRGFLFTTHWGGLHCWGLTDLAGWTCQLRRIDGLPFGNILGRGFKAWTVRGSYANWPLGCVESRPFERIAFVEGGGDLLAALHFALVEDSADRVAPIAMLGASLSIAPESLRYFQGKRIRIFAHVDQPNVVNATCAGLEAAARWQTQLSRAGADVECIDLGGLHKSDGSLVTDLNDLTSVDADDFESERALHSLMDF